MECRLAGSWPCSSMGDRRTLRGEHESQLSEHRELIGQRPVLDEPAVDESRDVNLLPSRRLARGWHAEELPEHRSARGQPADDFVVGDDLVLQVEANLGERTPDRCDGELHTLAIAVLRLSMVDEVWVEDLVDEGQIAPIEDALDIPTGLAGASQRWRSDTAPWVLARRNDHS